MCFSIMHSPLGKGCDLHHLIILTFRPSACQLSVVAPFRLQVLRSGTAYQMLRSVPVNLPAPSEDILIPLLLQH